MKSKTIKLKSVINTTEEYPASAAIPAGSLLQIASTGKVAVHATAAKVAYPIFAYEDELQGKTYLDSYAANDIVQCWVAQRGDVVNALIQAGQTIVIGDYLVSAGDGTLKKSAAATDFIIGIAQEAIDLSAGGAAATHAAVAIL